ncbi:MAG: M2 family metallopeptidase [Bacteroidales bacterium]|nr:M2 family metallopeptidase [Bacteroidales bacterium]
MKKLFLSLLLPAAVLITSCNNKEMELKELLTKIENEVKPLRTESNIAMWNGSISGNEEDFAKSAQAQEKVTAYLSNKEIFSQLKSFKESGKIKDPVLARQLDVVYNQFLANQADIALLNKIISKSTNLERMYGEYRASLRGKSITDNDVENILRTSTDNTELQQVWESHKGIGRVVEKDLIELVKMRNEVAQSLGFENYHSMSLELSGQDPKQITAILDELDSLTRDAFSQLKDEMDEAFAKRYKVKREELMPWHYQGRYFQEAPNLYPIDLDKFYEGKNLEKLTADFYHSIGLDINKMMSKSSLYPQEGKNQHAFCIDIDGDGDVRVLCNLASNEQWMGTMLHEFGHAIYAQTHDENRSLPYSLRDAAHIFTTEAVAMIFGRLSRNAAWMQKSLGLTDEQKESIEEECFKSLRLQQVVFSRWVQVVYRFEKEMYANPDQDLNGLWWNLVEKYQQIRKPEGRNEPDYATKIHIALYPCYYHNYQLGEIFASQMHNYIVTNISKSNDVKNECYCGNKEIGKWMSEKIFSPGMLLEWDKFIENATGERLTAKYYAEQFEFDVAE